MFYKALLSDDVIESYTGHTVIQHPRSMGLAACNRQEREEHSKYDPLTCGTTPTCFYIRCLCHSTLWTLPTNKALFFIYYLLNVLKSLPVSVVLCYAAIG